MSIHATSGRKWRTLSGLSAVAIATLCACASTVSDQQVSDPATIIVTAVPDPENQQAARQYIERVMPILIDGGGSIVRRGRITEPLVGEISYTAYLVMDFPSADSAKAVFASPEYAEIVPIRQRGFKSMDILITEGQ